MELHAAPSSTTSHDDYDSTPQTKAERVMLARVASGYSGDHWVTGAQEQARRASRRVNRRRSR